MQVQRISMYVHMLPTASMCVYMYMWIIISMTHIFIPLAACHVRTWIISIQVMIHIILQVYYEFIGYHIGLLILQT